MASRSKQITLIVAVLIILGLIWAAFKITSPELIKTKDGKYAIAILPFDNIGDNTDRNWVSDGMTEFISLRLQPNSEFLVISDNSINQFKNTESSFGEIAKQLGVSYLIKGSILHQNNSLLVDVQLVDELEQLIWTEDYEVPLDQLINVQASIANGIVDQLEVLLSPEKSKQLAHNPTNKVDAYKLFIEAKEIARTRVTENFPIALDLYQKAVLIDPSFAEAFAEIGHMHYFLHRDNLMSQEEAFHKINYYSNKAISLNPNVSRAYTIKSLSMLISGDINDSLYVGNFKKALEINPNDAIAYLQYADYYSSRYNYVRAVEILKEGVRLDPMSALINRIYCRNLARALESEEAKTHYDKIKFLLNEKEQKETEAEIVFAEAEKHLLARDWQKAEDVLLTAKSNLNNSDHYYAKLSHYYDVIMNNDSLHYEYAKRAFQLDSLKSFNASIYAFATMEYLRIDEANSFLESDTFYSLIPKNLHEQYHGILNYFAGNYQYLSSLIEEEDAFRNQYDIRLFTYAQMNNQEEVYKIYEERKISNTYKAQVHAILKNRDSMYHYLEQSDIDMRYVNGRIEFDPYRNDKQYKDLLKKYVIPVLE